MANFETIEQHFRSSRKTIDIIDMINK